MELPRFNNPYQYRFPIHVVIAAHRERELDYHTLLAELGQKMSGLMPYTFFILREHLPAFYADAAASVWHSDFTWNKGGVAFLDQIKGAQERTRLIDWHPLPRRQSEEGRPVELKPLAPSATPTHSRRDLAALTFSLYALDKQLLITLAAHPLLQATQLAFIVRTPVRSIRRSLKRLRQWRLVKAYVYRRKSAPRSEPVF